MHTMSKALLLLAFAAPLAGAQTPPPAAPCPSSSILLAAKPIKGVGATTIKNACPAFLAYLNTWYASHPAASVADVVAALNGAPAIVVPPPVVQPPALPSVPQPSTLAAVDFSTISTADLRAGVFWKGTGRDIAVSNPSAVSLDTIERAMRYDWPARAGTACYNAEYTVAAMPRWSPSVVVKDLWVKFTSKESPNFEHGSSSCMSAAGLAYKFFLIGFESGATNARFGTYLINASSTSMLPTFLSTDMVAGVNRKQGGGFPLGMTWGGQYHTWVLEMLGIGTSTATLNVYLDGKLMPGSISAAFLPGTTVGPGWAITFEMGANINNGPDHAQSRWFRELGVYTTRPSIP